MKEIAIHPHFGEVNILFYILSVIWIMTWQTSIWGMGENIKQVLNRKLFAGISKCFIIFLSIPNKYFQ